MYRRRLVSSIEAWMRHQRAPPAALWPPQGESSETALLLTTICSARRKISNRLRHSTACGIMSGLYLGWIMGLKGLYDSLQKVTCWFTFLSCFFMWMCDVRRQSAHNILMDPVVPPEHFKCCDFTSVCDYTFIFSTSNKNHNLIRKYRMRWADFTLSSDRWLTANSSSQMDVCMLVWFFFLLP